jgi:DNA-binding IclR family transcriptional regulator
MSVSGTPRDRDGAQSIRRAMAVLRILAAARTAGLGLSDISRQAGLTQPTAHRMLRVLVSEGIVEQNVRTRRYALGGEIPLMALARPAASPVLSKALPELSAAVEAFGDTGFLTLRSGLDTVCLARRVGRYPIQVLALDVGDRRPLGVSSAGFAMLAGLPAGEARGIIAQNASRLAPFGISADEAIATMAHARARGYALRERGLVPGTRAVSVTFEMPQRTGPPVLAALTIAAIARRLATARVRDVATHLQAACARIVGRA